MFRFMFELYPKRDSLGLSKKPNVLPAKIQKMKMVASLIIFLITSRTFHYVDCTPRTYEAVISTVRPRDTRPQAARTSQVHVFKLGPKISEMHVFARFCTFLHVFACFLANENLRCTFFD